MPSFCVVNLPIKLRLYLWINIAHSLAICRLFFKKKKKKRPYHTDTGGDSKVAMGTLALNGLAFVGLKSQTLCCINYVFVEVLCTEYEICWIAVSVLHICVHSNLC